MEHRTLRPFWLGPERRRQILASAWLMLSALAVVWGLWRVRPILSPFFLALVITYVLAPAVEIMVGRGRLTRPWAIVVLYLLLTLLVTALVTWVAPAALIEVQRLGESIPQYAEDVRHTLEGLHFRYRQLTIPAGVRASIDGYINTWQARASAFISELLSGTFNFVESLFSLVLAPILAFYFLKDLDHFKDLFAKMLPRRQRSDILHLLRQVDRVLAGFVRGQLILAAIVGAMSAAACVLLGLRFALLLGLVAGFFELIPYIGPLIGALPAVTVGALQSPWLAVKTALAFLLIQQIENAVIGPKIMGESIGLHPLMVVFAILAGGYLFGFAGLVLALPAAGILRVFWRYMWRQLT